jgi:hypothetical protein
MSSTTGNSKVFLNVDKTNIRAPDAKVTLETNAKIHKEWASLSKIPGVLSCGGGCRYDPATLLWLPREPAIWITVAKDFDLASLHPPPVLSMPIYVWHGRTRLN